MERNKDIGNNLRAAWGLPVKVKVADKEDGLEITVTPEGERALFAVRALAGWRHLEAQFYPGTFSASLIAGIRKRLPENFPRFRALASALVDRGAAIRVFLDDHDVDPLDSQDWSMNWREMTIGMSKTGLVHDDGMNYDIPAIMDWLSPFWGMVLSLMPLAITGMSTEDEGAAYLTVLTRYERSRINRAACIARKGICCAICGLDFRKMYGEIGTGFIHIHHIVPVSQMDGPVAVDPERDLIPVCANCHCMLHRRTPPYAPDELIGMILQNAKENPDASSSSKK